MLIDRLRMRKFLHLGHVRCTRVYAVALHHRFLVMHLFLLSRI